MDSLVPGEEALLRVATGWTPSAVGELSISYAVEAQATDEDVLDNTAQESMRITGPGWADGYGALASFTGMEDGGVVGDGVFVVLARAELSTEQRSPTGVSVILGGGCTVGTTVRGMIMDGNLSFLDSSMRRTLTEEDLQRINAGEPIFLPFEGASISGDVHFGVQSVRATDRLEVRCTGPIAPGAAVVLEGPFLDVDYIERSPMLRLHFEEVGVGMADADERLDAPLTFQAGNDLVVQRMDAQLAADVTLLDGSGRVVHTHRMAAGTDQLTIPVGQQPSGVFLVAVSTSEGRHVQRIALFTHR
ncbi:MAG: hypothetical protein MUE88_05340, partial [Flavobacteriales bacterium]|jgi:hypothetical protein|nr:hypothetical protein [Flavobacteriales bacterium]